MHLHVGWYRSFLGGERVHRTSHHPGMGHPGLALLSKRRRRRKKEEEEEEGAMRGPIGSHWSL